MRRTPLSFAWLVTLALASAGPGARTIAGERLSQSSSEEAILAAAKRIHRRAVTLDTHVDIPGPEYATAALDPGIDHPDLKCDLVKMVAGGVDGVFLAAYVGQGRRDEEGYRRAYDDAIAKIEAIRRLAETMHPDRCALATSPEDVLRIVSTGKRAVMIGIENGYVVGTDLANIQRFYDLGVRYITLCHNGHNQICDSCNPSSRLGDETSEHDGLSPFGEQVVAEMNRLGIMADVSHIAPQSFWDLVEVSQAPVIASHSGCGALNDHPRNLDDRQLKALAKGGGVIQVVVLSSFLKAPSEGRGQAIRELAIKAGIPMGARRPAYSEATEAQLERYREGIGEVNRQYPAASIKDFVDHIDHAVEVAGIDHVGVGSDFDGGGGIPGFNDHSEALNVTVELVRRGYSGEQIEKIWGGNLLRVWREVEAAAKRLQSEGKREEAAGGEAEANQERRVIDDMEDVSDWDNGSPMETTVSASGEHVREGEFSLKFANVVDHTRGEKNYPIGWPRTGKDLAGAGMSDWSGWDFFECRIYVHTDRDSLPGTPLGIGFYHSGPKRSTSVTLGQVEKNKWVKVTIGVTELDEPADVRRVQFHIAESNYKHGDRVDFYIDEMVLRRFVDPVIARFDVDRQLVYSNGGRIAASYALMGAKPLDGAKVELAIGRGDDAVAKIDAEASQDGEIALAVDRGLAAGTYWSRLRLVKRDGKLIDAKRTEFRVIRGPF